MGDELTRRGFAKAGLATTLGMAAGAQQGAAAGSTAADGTSGTGQSEPSAEKMTGADLVARQLTAHGVPFVSVLCGNGLDPFLVACKRHGLRLVDVRNEQAAGYMADALPNAHPVRRSKNLTRFRPGNERRGISSQCCPPSVVRSTTPVLLCV